MNSMVLDLGDESIYVYCSRPPPSGYLALTGQMITMVDAVRLVLPACSHTPQVRNTPSTARNSMTGSESPSPEPLLKKEASPAVLGGGREFWKCSGSLKCLELQGLGDPSRTLEGNSRKRSVSVSGVFPEFSSGFFLESPSRSGGMAQQGSQSCPLKIFFFLLWGGGGGGRCFSTPCCEPWFPNCGWRLPTKQRLN